MEHPDVAGAPPFSKALPHPEARKSKPEKRKFNPTALLGVLKARIKEIFGFAGCRTSRNRHVSRSSRDSASHARCESTWCLIPTHI